MKKTVLCLLIALSFIGGFSQATQLPPPTPTQPSNLTQTAPPPPNTMEQPANCPQQQMKDYANNYLVSLIGEDWFSKYYAFENVKALKLTNIDSNNSYLIAASYSFDYSPGIFPRIELYLTFILNNDTEADCQNMSISSGYGIIRPFNVSIDSTEALNIFRSHGYNVSSVSISFNSYNENASKILYIYTKPVYSAPIEYTVNCGPVSSGVQRTASCPSKYGYVDVETGRFFTENATMPTAGGSAPGNGTGTEGIEPLGTPLVSNATQPPTESSSIVIPVAIVLVLFIVFIALTMLRRLGPQKEPDDSEVYRALSSDTRIDILNTLLEGERTPTDISSKLNKSKATIAEHLDKLREADLVEKIEVDGRKWVFYKLTPRGKSIIKKGG